MWIILTGVFLLSLWSTVEGIKNRSRFIINDRIKYYFFGLLLSVVFSCLVIYSSTETDTNIGLLIVLVITLTLIFGNLFYYTRVEKIKNALEIKFRILKYLLFSIMLLFLNLIIYGIINK